MAVDTTQYLDDAQVRLTPFHRFPPLETLCALFNDLSGLALQCLVVLWSFDRAILGFNIILVIKAKRTLAHCVFGLLDELCGDAHLRHHVFFNMDIYILGTNKLNII